MLIQVQDFVVCTLNDMDGMINAEIHILCLSKIRKIF